MNLDHRSVPYRILEDGLRIFGVLAFALLASADGGTGSSGGGFNIRQGLTLFVLGLSLVALWETAYVRRYEYEVKPDTFDIQSGVVSRREREIPFERIQNVDIAQNVIQRTLGIAEVRLETAGGGSSEARLRYVSRPEATRLQELISDRKREETERDPGASDDILFELNRRELTILGLTSANFRLLGLIVVGVSLVAPPVARQLSPSAEILLLLGPGVAVGALLLLWVASGLQSVLRYYGFRLLRHDEELRYQRGLLQRYTGTIPLAKVQTLMVRENVLARAVGYGSLVIETAGYAPGQGSENVESAVPIARRDRVFELVETIEDIDDVTLIRPPKRARLRYVARYTIAVGVFTGMLGVVHLVTGGLPSWSLAAGAAVLVPPAAHLKWTHLGYYYDEDYVVTRSGFWTRRTTIVPYYRVQTVSNSQSIFQRRRDLGTLVVDTASSGGFWGGNAVALDIDADEAASLRERVNDRFQRSITYRKAD
ncbi:MAG: PH domain-containing protein [Halovenus sp.]